jgi:uncharacterized metal-binding protein
MVEKKTRAPMRSRAAKEEKADVAVAPATEAVVENRRRDCSDCDQLNCHRNDAKYPPFCLTLAHRKDVEASRRTYVGDGLDARLAKASGEVESEYYGRLTRLEETVVFAKKMGVKKLGVASCLALRNESAFFASVVRTADIEPKMVICKVGSIDKCEIGVLDEDKLMPNHKEACCNPALQAKILDDWGSELNVVVGLCVGHDALFFKHSKAPAVVLVAKDRVLAHNPAAAAYLSNSFYSRVKDFKTFGKPRRAKTSS